MMTPLKNIKTERLRLRAFKIDDAAFILKLLNSPGWLRFIGDRKIHSLDDARNYLENGPMKGYKLNGFGLMLIELISNAEPIGMCGLIKRETLEDIDIGYALLPEFEGKGFAFEAAQAVMNDAKNVLKLKRVVAITAKDNERSAKLLNKIGLYFEKPIRLTEDGEELLFFGTPKMID